MNRYQETNDAALPERLRRDAAQVSDGPSDAAKQRLRAALAKRPSSHGSSAQPPAWARRSWMSLASAAALVLLIGTLTSGLVSHRGDDAEGRGPQRAQPATLASVPERRAVPAALTALLSVQPTAALLELTEEPLQAEIDAVLADAGALADAVLRSVPPALVPNRARERSRPGRSR